MELTGMRVTVITPTHNRINLLRETIESVLAQNYPDLEYLVLDDGSTDNTQELLARYQDRLTVVHHPNMGETRTVNKGFMMASGDIVGVINSDDPLLPGAIHRIVQAFRENPEAVAVYPDWATIDEHHRFLATQRLHEYNLASMLLNLDWGLGPGTFMRTSAIRALNGRNPNLVYCGDMEFWLRLAAHGKMVHLPRTLATHRVHSGSMSLSGRGPLLMAEWVGVIRTWVNNRDTPPSVLAKKGRILARAYHAAARHYSRPGDWGSKLKYHLIGCFTPLWLWINPWVRDIGRFIAKKMFDLLVWIMRKRIGYKLPSDGYNPHLSTRFAISTRFVPPLWSGQSVVLGRLLRGIPADAYRLVRLPLINAGNNQDFVDKLPGKGIDLPPEFILRGARFSQWLRVINLFIGALQRGPAIARALKDEKIDTIVGCSGDVVDPPASFLAARILGCRFFFYFFDDYTEQWWAEPRLQAAVARVERFVAPRANGLISPNEFMRDELRRRYGKFSFVVRNPCPWEQPTPQDFPDDEKPAEFKIVFTGAVYHLNHDIFRALLKAVEHVAHPNARLHIYTAQPAEELAQQGLTGPRLQVHAHITPAEATVVQQQADLLVIPFSFAPEAAGIVKRSATAKLADYLMAGGPILAICPEDSFLGWYLTTHDCGIVVNSEDAEVLAKRINPLIIDPKLRDRLRRNAHERARSDFSPDIAQKEMLRAIGFTPTVESVPKSHVENPDYSTVSAHATPAPKPAAENPVSVLQISGYDTLGIQVNGYLLHRHLNDEGHTSRMLVYQKMSDDPSVMELGSGLARKANRVAQGLQKVLSTQNTLPILGTGIANHPWAREADVINLQLIHNAQFFSLLSLPGLTRRHRVVLSVHDMFLFSGHCIYSMDCERWQHGCGSCPGLDLPFPITMDTSAINWKLKKWAFDHSNLDLIVGSPWQKERVSRSPILSRFPLHYIPYGVNTRFYKQLDRRVCREQLGIPPDAQVIAFRSVPFSKNFKGTQYIEEALRAYNPAKPTFLLTFEGIGGLTSLRDKYSFVELGWVSDQSLIAGALNAADVFLMPSIAEAFGLMAIESMACGTPVIVFEGTALPETINAPKCGMAVPAKDSAALERAIEAILENDSMREEFRQNGLRHVAEQHTFELYANRYLDLYRELAMREKSHV